MFRFCCWCCWCCNVGVGFTGYSSTQEQRKIGEFFVVARANSFIPSLEHFVFLSPSFSCRHGHQSSNKQTNNKGNGKRYPGTYFKVPFFSVLLLLLLYDGDGDGDDEKVLYTCCRYNANGHNNLIPPTSPIANPGSHECWY